MNYNEGAEIFGQFLTAIICLVALVLFMGFLMEDEQEKEEIGEFVEIGEVLFEEEDIRYSLTGITKETIILTATYENGVRQEYSYPYPQLREIKLVDTDSSFKLLNTIKKEGRIKISISKNETVEELSGNEKTK